MMKMKHMDEDKIMDMKHEMMEMEDFEHMHMFDHHVHHKDEENKEMYHKSNCEIKGECKCRNLKTNCLTVNIDEIIN